MMTFISDWRSRSKYAYMYKLPKERRLTHIKKTVGVARDTLRLQIYQDTKNIHGDRYYRQMFLHKPVEMPRESPHEYRVIISPNPDEVEGDNDELAARGSGRFGSLSERAHSRTARSGQSIRHQDPRELLDRLPKTSLVGSSVNRLPPTEERSFMYQERLDEEDEAFKSSRMTGAPSSSSITNANKTIGSEHKPDDSYVFELVNCRDFMGSFNKPIIVAKSKSRLLRIAIRSLSGIAGYSEWMSELQVYLLPNFAHENILDFYGSFRGNSDGDIESNFPKIDAAIVKLITPKPDMQNGDSDDDDGTSRAARSAKASGQYKPSSVRVGYWLMNDFYDTRILRHYLRAKRLTWMQLVEITRGIFRGLHYLHEHEEHQNLDSRKIVDSFIKSTNGVLKKVSFIDTRNVVYMKPHVSLSVVHRNLSSLNIVLTKDLTPKIWNFTLACLKHPLQPSNQKNYISADAKAYLLSSVYSPPEILRQRGNFSLAGSKAIDLYACGIIMWEMLSRTALPQLEPATDREQADRSGGARYREPFEAEFGLSRSALMLQHAVCKVGARPTIKRAWLAGRKSNKYVQTMQDLWDQDAEARIHSCTVLDRLSRYSFGDQDSRTRTFFRPGTTFSRRNHWPPSFEPHGSGQPHQCGPNKKFEEVVLVLPEMAQPQVSGSEDESFCELKIPGYEDEEERCSEINKEGGKSLNLLIPEEEEDDGSDNDDDDDDDEYGGDDDYDYDNNNDDDYENDYDDDGGNNNDDYSNDNDDDCVPDLARSTDARLIDSKTTIARAESTFPSFTSPTPGCSNQEQQPTTSLPKFCLLKKMRSPSKRAHQTEEQKPEDTSTDEAKF